MPDHAGRWSTWCGSSTRAHVPTLILAGGSNLVIGDDGFDGSSCVWQHDRSSLEAGFVVRRGGRRVGRGGRADRRRRSWAGSSACRGFPGPTGATPVQNVGAYGVEVGSLLRRVQLLDRRTGEARWVEPGRTRSRLPHERPQALRRRRWCWRWNSTVHPDGLSEPLRYRELVAGAAVPRGRTLPSAQVRDAVLGLRRGQGHGARSRRPRHLERGLLLHQPGRCRTIESAGVLAAIATRARRRPCSAVPGRRRNQAVGGVADRAGRLREGVSRARTRRAAVDQAHSRPDQSRRRDERGPAGTGPGGPGRRPGRRSVCGSNPEPVTVGCAI